MNIRSLYYTIRLHIVFSYHIVNLPLVLFGLIPSHWVKKIGNLFLELPFFSCTTKTISHRFKICPNVHSASQPNMPRIYRGDLGRNVHLSGKWGQGGRVSPKFELIEIFRMAQIYTSNSNNTFMKSKIISISEY